MRVLEQADIFHQLRSSASGSANFYQQGVDVQVLREILQDLLRQYQGACDCKRLNTDEYELCTPCEIKERFALLFKEAKP